MYINFCAHKEEESVINYPLGVEGGAVKVMGRISKNNGASTESSSSKNTEGEVGSVRREKYKE